MTSTRSAFLATFFVRQTGLRPTRLSIAGAVCSLGTVQVRNVFDCVLTYTDYLYIHSGRVRPLVYGRTSLRAVPCRALRLLYPQPLGRRSVLGRSGLGMLLSTVFFMAFLTLCFYSVTCFLVYFFLINQLSQARVGSCYVWYYSECCDS